MAEQKVDKVKVIALLNTILEMELAGVVRYTHYSFMVYGFNRIPIISWLREQADESLLHAQQAGEMITALGEHPSLGIGRLLESQKHDITAILQEALEHEGEGLRQYRELLSLVEGIDVVLEEYARQMVHQEQLHSYEVDKMLRKPGDVGSFAHSK